MSIIAIEEVPAEDAPTSLTIIGRYILTPEIFTYLRKTKPGENGEVQITNALKLLATDRQVLAVKFKDRRFDCSSADGFIETTNYYYENVYKNT